MGLGLSAALDASGVRLGALPLPIHAAVALALVQLPLPQTTHVVLAGALVAYGWAPGVAVASLLGGHAWPGGLRRHLRGTPQDVRAALVGGAAAMFVGACVATLAGTRGMESLDLDARSAPVAGILLGAWLVARLVARGPRGWITDVLGPSTHHHGDGAHDHASRDHGNAHDHSPDAHGRRSGDDVDDAHEHAHGHHRGVDTARPTPHEHGRGSPPSARPSTLEESP